MLTYADVCWQYKEAADAYEKGKDYDSLVRLCLEHLKLPHRAYAIVREIRGTASAQVFFFYALVREVRGVSSTKFMYYISNIYIYS